MASNRYGVVVPLMFLLGWIFLICPGCGSGSDQDVSDTDRLVSGNFIGFSSNDELASYLMSQFTKSVYTDYPYALDTVTAAAEDEATGAGDSTMDVSAAETAADYTGTNLQEFGVDEPDSVKTDGSCMYIASGDTLYIVSVDDAMTVVGSTKVAGSIDSLYLYDDMVILLYHPADYAGRAWVDPETADIELVGIPYWIPVEAKTGIAIYDVSDPASPYGLKTIESDGYLVASRRIDNHLHVIQQFLPDLPSPEVLEEEIQNMDLEDLVPYYTETADSGSDGQSTQLIAPEDFYHPDIDGGGSIVSIMSFDLDDPDFSFASTGVVADASVVYASTQALYFTSTYWNWIQADDEEPAEQTAVYKFSLADGLAVGQGYQSVDGRVLNQFSLGEYDGVLRIATTTGWSWDTSAPSENHVYCLGSQGGYLSVVGRIEDIAPGEELYAARFIGPRGYLVTFVNTDPLFTLDLSDPTDPSVAGELVVPGYSTYIHPYGEDHLICIGKDAIEEEGFAWYQGLQLSVFDISDFSFPQLLHNVIIGDRGTSSEALFNHKAFTFWEENGLLAIPIDLCELQSLPDVPYAYGEWIFSGVYIYDVSIDGGFEFAGRISTQPDIDPYGYISNEWTRSIFMDSDVYAITPNSLYTAPIDELDGTVDSIELNPSFFSP